MGALLLIGLAVVCQAVQFDHFAYPDMRRQGFQHSVGDSTPQSFIAMEAPPAGPKGCPKNADGDEECHSAPVTEAQQSAKDQKNKDDGRDPKLVAALEAIKSDLMAKGHEYKEEKAWLSDVALMMATYHKKLENVRKNVLALKTDMKELLHKKRQVENLELQQQLDKKMEVATKDMKTLNSVIDHVESRLKQFHAKKTKYEETISHIQSQLDQLQGKDKKGHDGAEGKHGHDGGSGHAGGSGGSGQEAKGKHKPKFSHDEGDETSSDVEDDATAAGSSHF